MPSASIPAGLATAGVVASLAGASVGAYGAIESSQAQSNAASYQAQVSENNSKIATQNANYATAAGEAQVTQQQLKTAATVGGIRASEAASGLDVNSGSDLDVQSSAKELGELDALTIRNAAAKQAYGYQVQSTSDVASGQLQEASASQDLTAGMFGATGSVLGGASSSANSYARFLQNSGGGTAPNVLGSNY